MIMLCVMESINQTRMYVLLFKEIMCNVACIYSVL